MYCKNCGKEIDDKAAVCMGCGCLTGAENQNNINTVKSNYKPIIGFILSLVAATFALIFNGLVYDSVIIGMMLALLLPVGALICSALEYKTAKERNGKPALALAGTIISAVICGLWLTAFWLY